jgi:Ca2+-binding EF-hand superfamily protein
MHMKTIISAAAALALGFGAAGVLNAEEIQLAAGSQKSFEEVDSNGDGQVTREEADSAGISINWEEADPDGNGSLTREEYESATKDSSM